MKQLIVLLVLQCQLFSETNLLLQRAARTQIGVTTRYDARYKPIPYPNGDVDIQSGVCTDVLIRAFRRHGIDLQRLVHNDMRANFKAYPQRWGLHSPDPNIDHRRVPNLMVYFRRSGKQLLISNKSVDYSPGDIVAWDLGGGVTHIGLVSDEEVPGSGNRKIIHNIGRGVQLEDILFRYRIIGHYRYFKD
jgi:uncharacterized protein